MLAVAEEVADLQRLLDLLEEDLNAPSRLIEFADGAGGPVRVVGDEDHYHLLAIDGDNHFNPAQKHGVLFFALRGFQQDEVVSKDVAARLAQHFFAHGVGHVVLDARHPEDATQGKVVEMGEVDVGLVKQGNLAFLKVSAEFRGTGVVVMAGFLDNGISRQEALEVEPQVQLGGGLAAAVFGPAHAVGHQCDGGGVHGVNSSLEPSGHPLVAYAESSRHQPVEVAERSPEEVLHHVTVAVFVGVGECVACRGNSTPETAEPARVNAKRITDIVESDGVVVLAEIAFEQKEVAAFAQDFNGVPAVIARVHAHKDGVLEFEFFEQFEVALQKSRCVFLAVLGAGAKFVVV